METLKKISGFGAIIIVDLFLTSSIENKIKELFSNFKLKNEMPIYFLENNLIIKNLREIIFQKINLNPFDSIFIFPGESGFELGINLLASIQLDYYFLKVFAQRIWVPGNDPVVTVETLYYLNEIYFKKIKNVIVVDDVISSGETLSLLYKRNNSKFNSKTKWYASTLISRKQKVTNYENILCNCYLEDSQNKKTPINSLSKFFSNQEIFESYVKRNFCNPKELIKCFLEIKNEIKKGPFDLNIGPMEILSHLYLNKPR